MSVIELEGWEYEGQMGYRCNPNGIERKGKIKGIMASMLYFMDDYRQGH